MQKEVEEIKPNKSHTNREKERWKGRDGADDGKDAGDFVVLYCVMHARERCEDESGTTGRCGMRDRG